jgi:hypothetical protein
MLKKSLALLLTSTFVLTTLTACGKSAEEKKVEEQEKKHKSIEKIVENNSLLISCFFRFHCV